MKIGTAKHDPMISGPNPQGQRRAIAQLIRLHPEPRQRRIRRGQRARSLDQHRAFRLDICGEILPSDRVINQVARASLMAHAIRQPINRIAAIDNRINPPPIAASVRAIRSGWSAQR